MTKRTLYEQLQREWQDLVATLLPERLARAHWQLQRSPARAASPVVLFAELEDARQAWDQLCASPQVNQYSDRFITAAWTLKDLLGHLASWVTEIRREAAAVAQGEAFDYIIPYALSVVGPNQWNQVEVEKRRPLPLRAVYAEATSEIASLQELVLATPEELLVRISPLPLSPTGDPTALWKASISQLVLMQCMHQRLHLSRIEHWLSTQSATRQKDLLAKTGRARH